MPLDHSYCPKNHLYGNKKACREKYAFSLQADDFNPEVKPVFTSIH